MLGLTVPNGLPVHKRRAAILFALLHSSNLIHYTHIFSLRCILRNRLGWYALVKSKHIFGELNCDVIPSGITSSHY